jgi:hypothetical protein
MPATHACTGLLLEATYQHWLRSGCPHPPRRLRHRRMRRPQRLQYVRAVRVPASISSNSAVAAGAETRDSWAERFHRWFCFSPMGPSGFQHQQQQISWSELSCGGCNRSSRRRSSGGGSSKACKVGVRMHDTSPFVRGGGLWQRPVCQSGKRVRAVQLSHPFCVGGALLWGCVAPAGCICFFCCRRAMNATGYSNTGSISHQVWCDVCSFKGTGAIGPRGWGRNRSALPVLHSAFWLCGTYSTMLLLVNKLRL